MTALLMASGFTGGLVIMRFQMKTAAADKIEVAEARNQEPIEIDDVVDFFLEENIGSEYSQEVAQSSAEVEEDYLSEVIGRVYKIVQDSGVDVSIIPPAVLYTLIVVEHFSTKMVDDSVVRGEIDRIMATIGNEKAEAFRDVVSSQKARGLCQIIPSTYKSLRARYPRLLMKDFLKGTADHPNAITAQLLLAYEDLQFLFSQPGWRGNKDAQDDFLDDAQYLGQYLAVAYNGGGPRAYRWEASGRIVRLPRETARYLVKFDKVWEVLYPSEPIAPNASALAMR